MKVIGYRNEVYGDERTECIEVYELDNHEILIQALLKETRKQIEPLLNKKHGGSLMTPKEKGRLAELQAVEGELISDCKHRVFLDEGGFSYYTRTCQVCGSFMGTV